MRRFHAVGKQVLLAAACLVVSGCTVHPAGEKQERQSAALAGQPYEMQAKERSLPTLSATPTSDELVRYALLASPELEQKYWEWRSAIEQIPQDGTQAANLMLFAGVPITHGSTAFDRTTVTVANDPMADIVWPTKLSAAAQRALGNAKAAGFRFQKAKYDLRQKVLNAYYDHALAVETLKLDQADVEILTTASNVTEAGIGSGRSTQSDAIKARNELDLLNNQIIEESARLPALRSALSVTIGRDPTAALAPATSIPAVARNAYTQDQLLQLVVDRNPEALAQKAEHAARQESVQLAHLQYQPDFSLSAGTDFGGSMQSLLGSITVPYLRHEAIDAAIAQAEANLRSTDAMQRQNLLDLSGRILADQAAINGAEKQLALLEDRILPRAQENSHIIRSSYESGHSSMLDLFDAQRSVLAIQRLVLQLKVFQERQRVDAEAAIAMKL